MGAFVFQVEIYNFPDFYKFSTGRIYEYVQVTKVRDAFSTFEGWQEDPLLPNNWRSCFFLPLFLTLLHLFLFKVQDIWGKAPNGGLGGP